MICAAILAGGIGSRLKQGKPKQFVNINNKPILVHSVEIFLSVDELDKIIVSSPKECVDKTNDLMDEYFPKNDKIIVIEGGETRNGTILNSIQYMKGQNCEKDSILVTHDASRIFVSKKLIKDSIKYAIEVGAASAAIPATDVIFETEIDGKLTGVPLRKYLCHAQTPQSFNIDKFLDIYEDLSEEEISKLDEAMVLFHLRNADVKLFPGDQNNFKITRPFDIKLAESIFKN
ncbi:MAG: 2-C-methyl-D-erythritol 4-phosphate cytidylyltransferase [archaeon]|uniref:2-C-methyl-D-erythritol 4-phosphate cytidylyltransferase n=1 Tax=Methanobrevibacter gottschalkii DSM 11977 TaxID=1122229 RepID=A0A3N5B368_9EURY|nr:MULTISPECIES: 2-C-methyl-D-erythritol 4-phosphate cytidylyltransferase [Methanobrevibacter]MCQ2970043.1 2-C-methyl-D-erythritol 4-phosphate cytidylyltransferase [archaeon]OEC98000.1 2-C-methyl-D-erythritol 4-phosphate cytidylyltransferase [Methanobrevibacter sp. A27]RPF51737.1 2-C-methyl-D-erythritol 4-phosphate cytidylyltransferase [Methanobrevibacter gottschalkii DSM 11977]